MKFGMNPSPYYRGKRSTTQIMLELMIGLAVIWVCAIAYYFTTGTGNGIRAIVNPIIAMLTAVVTECLFMLPKHVKEKGKVTDLVNKLFNSYGYVTGMILALLLPVATSVYAIVISTIFAIAVAKMVFGGFGHNIFNPAIAGRIFAQMAFLSKMAYDTEVSTGATITTILGQNGWSLDILDYANHSLSTLLIGNYRGTLGETFTLVLLVVGIVLAIRKVIDWRAPVFYLGTIAVGSFIMGLVGGYGLDSFEYALVQLSVGGVMFGAVFCITDPVTSPTSRAGRVYFGIGAAIITMLIRYLASAPEGVAYSILFMNMFTPLIDSCVKGLSNQFKRNKIITTCVMGAVAIGAGAYIGASQVNKLGFVNYKNSLATQNKDFTSVVKKISSENGIDTYNVAVTGTLATNTVKSYKGVDKIFVNALAKYADSNTYPNAKYVVNEKDSKSLDLVYGQDQVISKVLTLKAIKSTAENPTWIIQDTVSNYQYDTLISAVDYESVYSLEIDDDLNIVLTFANGHASSDESPASYASVNFDVSVDYAKKMIVGTKLNSSGAGGGVGDAMLDPDNVQFNFNFISIANAAIAAQFYEKYIEVEEPVPFETYTKFDSTSFDITDVDKELKTGATYTAKGFMYAINRVIEFATYENNAKTAGKVVR